jgi:hypothetical protein
VGHHTSAELIFGHDGPHPCPAHLNHAPSHLVPLGVNRMQV